MNVQCRITFQVNSPSTWYCICYTSYIATSINYIINNNCIQGVSLLRWLTPFRVYGKQEMEHGNGHGITGHRLRQGSSPRGRECPKGKSLLSVVHARSTSAAGEFALGAELPSWKYERV